MLAHLEAEDAAEAPMVRHKAALALGALGDDGISPAAKAAWAANKRFKILKLKFKFPIALGGNWERTLEEHFFENCWKKVR